MKYRRRYFKFGHEVIALCRQPAFTVWRDTAAGHDESLPGAKSKGGRAHGSPCYASRSAAHRGGQSHSNPLWVARRLLDGRDRLEQQESVNEFLVAASDRA